MEFRVTGNQILHGDVTVDGAKNSATRVLAAALISDGKVNLRNFPLHLEDVKAKLGFIENLGAKTSVNKDSSELALSVDTLNFDGITDYGLPIRTTYLLAAGMLARNEYARIPYPGGCKIGDRGYDLHMMVWRELGCKVTETPDYIEVEGSLQGGTINFPLSTVGGTENALICAAVANGYTEIRNAYITPEVEDLIAFLREMGAQIELDGSSMARVKGNGGLLRGASFSIMPDRIEALTWIVLAAITNSTIRVKNVPFDVMEVPLIHLQHAGIDYMQSSNDILVSPECVSKYGIQPFELACGTHPGVISDMQSFFVLLAMFAAGRSKIFDYRYPERIAYAKELDKFNPGFIEPKPGEITVIGRDRLIGTRVKSTDLRGSMALVMAAIAASGESEVTGVELALRGYNNLPHKLAQLGLKAEWHN